MAGHYSPFWSALAVVGKVDVTDAELAEVLPLVETLDPRELYEAILASRVYTIARCNLERLPEDGNTKTVLSFLHELESEERLRRDRARGETRAVLEQAGRTGARVIKGLPLREWYRQPELRHEGDIDLQVPDWPRGRQLADWLRDRGWQWDTQEFPWVKWTETEHIYGQLTLVLPDNADPFARVDLHIGPFSVGHAGLLPLVGWEAGTVMGVPATVPSREAALALVAAHAVNDGFLSMKDVNDMHVLLADQPPPDWASIEELCRSAHAVPALQDLLGMTKRIYGIGAPGRAGPPRYLSTRKETPGGRARRVARLTFRDERARGASLPRATLLARQAQRYFSARLTPRLGRASIPGPIQRFQRRNLCWRLIPEERWRAFVAAGSNGSLGPLVEQAIGPGLQLVRAGQGSIVRCGREVFVPTVWGEIHPDSVALASQVARAG